MPPTGSSGLPWRWRFRPQVHAGRVRHPDGQTDRPPRRRGRAVGTPAGTIRMPPESRSGSRAADGHQSRIIQRARTRQASVPGNAEAEPLPQPRPPGRRPMRSPGSSIFLFRYHAERRGRAEENARGPAVRRGLVGRVASSGKDPDGTFRAVRVAPPALRELDQVNYLRSCWPWPERPSGSVGGPLGLAACRLMWCQTRATPGAER
jgi:hypothetical protein